MGQGNYCSLAPFVQVVNSRMPKKDGTLTRKEKEFAQEFVACGSAAKAYFNVYGCEYTTAKATGYKLLRNPVIKEYVIGLQKEAFAAACINAERVGLKLAEIAFSAKGDEDYNATAQLKALDLLQKQLGLQTQKVEADISTDINITIEE